MTLSGPVIVLTSFLYLGLLFAVAYYGDKRADAGRSLMTTPYIYALSIAVYCTSWTFYGSVGRASVTGIGFLPVYLGPTLTFLLGWFVLRKIVRISKVNRITSIADFISSRYGKSHLLGGLVTIIAVVGIMPYISIQLKAVSISFNVLLNYPDVLAPIQEPLTMFADTAFWVAALMAAFSILFGTRHIDATEHHEGMVIAIAFESVIKLVAFMAVGLFVTFGLFDGPGAIFSAAQASPEMARLLTFEAAGGTVSWITVTLLSMAAIIVLPRQFQVVVVENVDESHLNKAFWLLPLYLVAINLFVLPIALGGLITFPDGAVDADTFVLALPMLAERPLLALFVFIGGLSAATGMVIVASVALSTMVCNDLVMPVLLRFVGLHRRSSTDMPALLLGIRRIAIIGILFLGYGYYRSIGESYALVTIGLVSFTAAAQFAPPIIGGMYWKNATRSGALAGLTGGFLMWSYVLLLPSFAQSGWLPLSFVQEGPFGIALLKPYSLFGLEGLDRNTHALFWTMFANIGLYVGISLVGRQSSIERIQATLFVEVFKSEAQQPKTSNWRGTADVRDLRAVAERFVGKDRADLAFHRFAQNRGLNLGTLGEADAEMVQFTERLLAGAIGAASARVTVASVVKGEGVSFEEMMQILDEASQVIEYSRQLEQKSQALERATSELRSANIRLRELDQLKDEFLSTVTHELRTPLTSIRSLSEILYADPDIEAIQRQQFIGIIVKETERLTRLINQVLDFAKMEAGQMDWSEERFDPSSVLRDAAQGLMNVFKEQRVDLAVDIPETAPTVLGDPDALTQVLVNLLGNAAKFSPAGTGKVTLTLQAADNHIRVSVADNGPGIQPKDREMIFEKFQQIRSGETGNTHGSGLGLAITKKIIEKFDGNIWVEGEVGQGSTFIFTLPTVDDPDEPDHP